MTAPRRRHPHGGIVTSTQVLFSCARLRSRRSPASIIVVIEPRETTMRKSLCVTAMAAAPTIAPGTPNGIAQETADQQLGAVHFATSCNEAAQRRFDRAMRYQHSFWYKASKEIFEDTLKADPTCGIAYWGIALGLLDNPHNPPPAPNLPLGLAAIQAAKSAGAQTQRERDYIDAMASMYVDYDKTTHTERVQSYLKTME